MIQENVKVMIVDGTSETSRIAKEMIQACDDIVVLGGPTQSNSFDLHMYHEPPTPYNAVLKAPVKHGAYRKFIKCDKRKNFKVNK
tara:strand:+ start:185 stop:439 length:255 start_codon:yes stop_codon:yes gene_type:complete